MIALRIFLDLDTATIARQLGIAAGTVRMHLSRGVTAQQADFVLIDTNSYTCSSTPPDPNGMPAGYGPDDGIGILYGGPGRAGS